MEAQLHRTHERDHEDRQHSTTDVHGREKRSGETKSTMKKVKEKVDKLKATIKHGHHGGSELKDEAETVNNSSVVRSGLVEPTVMGTPVLAEDIYASHSDILDPPVRSFAQWQDEEKRGPLPTTYDQRDENKEPLKGSIGKHTHVQVQEEKDDAPPLSTDMPHGDHHSYGGDVNREQLKGSVGNPNEETRDAPPPSTGYESLTDRYGEDVVHREPLMGSSFGKMGRYGAPPPPPYVDVEYDQVVNRGNPPGYDGAGVYETTRIYETTDDQSQSRLGYDAYGEEQDLNTYPVISAQVVEEDSTDTGGRQVRITEANYIRRN